MTLAEYLSIEGSPSMTALAERIGVSKGRLSQLRDATDWPPELALEAEKQTAGALDAGHLSPTVARARQALNASEGYPADDLSVRKGLGA